MPPVKVPKSDVSREDLKKIALLLGADIKPAASKSDIVKSALTRLRGIRNDLSAATGLRKDLSLSAMTSQTIEQLGTQREELETPRGDFRKCADQRDIFQAENERLDAQNLSRKNSYSSLSDECTTIRELCSGLEKDNEALEAENKKLQDERDQAKRKSTELQKERDSQNSIIAGLELIVADKDSIIAAKDSIIENKENYTNNVSGSAAKAQAEAREQVDEARVEAEEARVEADAARVEADVARVEADEARVKTSKYKQDFEEMSKEVGRLHEQKRDAIDRKAEFNVIWQDVEDLSKRYRHADDNTDELKRATTHMHVWNYLCRNFWSCAMPSDSPDIPTDKASLERLFPTFEFPQSAKDLSKDLDSLFNQARELQNKLGQHGFAAHIEPAGHLDDLPQLPAVAICIDHGPSGCFQYLAR